ncbi:MAG: Esterase TesA [Rhodobiaceae bacterium UBA7378]|nr:MAG: Esterase TesA [Rhodobiaceae bacterium UBA7378]|tara:strand:+ start:163 stop:960 length:798 start_codon:yes stop_codon:yes gene_type:complete
MASFFVSKDVEKRVCGLGEILLLAIRRGFREYPSPWAVASKEIYVRHAAISITLAFAMIFFISVVAAPSPVQASEKENSVTLVALGDSLTAGFGLQPADGFTPKLEAYLRARGHNVRVVNGGVSGDTSSGGLARFDWAVPQDAHAIIIELGANDALRGINPNLTRANLTKIIEKSKDRGLSVLLAGMLAPPNLGPAYAEAFAAIYPTLAAQYDVPLYPFFLDGVAAQKSLNLADGIHPNAAGIDIIVSRIGPYAERLISNAASRE